MKSESKALAVRFPLTTILSVVFTVVLIRGITIILPLVLPLLIAILIAVSLTPILDWFVQKGLPRRAALLLVTAVLGLSIAVLMIAILPRFYDESVAFIKNLPKYREDLLSRIGEGSPLNDLLAHSLTREALVPRVDKIEQILVAGNLVLGSFIEVFVIAILSIYLVSDGPRIIGWLAAFFAPETQNKIHNTLGEVAKIISAYVLGQFLTSALSFLYVLICLFLLHVPNALLLATLAGVLDVLPALGFVLAVVPAMLFATNVSTGTAWIVLGLYTLYHILENYLIIPVVYGTRMRMSSFVVFFSLLAAGLIGGIEAVIVVLPIVASYPIIERIWLRRYVRQEAVIEHSAGSELEYRHT